METNEVQIRTQCHQTPSSPSSLHSNRHPIKKRSKFFLTFERLKIINNILDSLDCQKHRYYMQMIPDQDQTILQQLEQVEIK